ncbi:hypothetical protein TTHERM_00069190 (macronuclear) [Tetrahymena thermophila SB210]|uniref:Kinase domain protein n=1 Tax=Tetrahymena thermophila (strain SB210) TaxID=312017 RepID=I7LTY2_TETTS|nr:hypothetical protein TTHERM_00069190 [Tetrahymena thermophila SB210]EAR87512.2 hypothetical protein TTHERM_00069190 [Tetrahymena thermophila SB210]|eukprot:XP_001007757.2 hypothetical protein TTHERM_00069190 [Tetrahymena thermophila SB210]
MEYYDNLENIQKQLTDNLSNKCLRVELSPYLTEPQLNNFKFLMKDLEYDSLFITSWEQNIWKKEGFTKLSNFYSDLCHLKKFGLKIFVNDLNPVGSEILAQGLSNLNNIQELTLDLTSCPVQDQGLNYFLEAISQLDKLQSISLLLDEIKIGKNGIEGIFNTIQKNICLKKLEISFDTNTTSKFYQEISNGLQKLIGLEKLIIQVKAEKQSQIYEITNSIQILENLKYLLLEIQSNEKLVDLDIQIIGMLDKLQNLSTLYFYVHSYKNNLHKNKLLILSYLNQRQKIIDFKINHEEKQQENVKLIQKTKKIKQLVFVDFFE